MKITRTITYQASPEAVADALLSDALAAKRAAYLDGGSVEHSRSGSRATTKVTVPADKLPSKVRSFAKNGAKAVITTTAEASTISYTVDLQGVPAELAARMTLAGEATTTADLAAEFKVKIPLLGATVEKRAAGMVDRFLAADITMVEQVIAEASQ